MANFAQFFTSKAEGWVSVKERLPENHDLVMVFRESGTTSVGWHHLVQKRWYQGHTNATGTYAEQYVTHWRELPSPPKEG